MVKRSPGPWHWGAGYWSSSESDRCLYAANGDVIVDHDPEWMGDGVAEADARLIAAAPQMLELLQRAVTAIEPTMRGRGVWGQIDALLDAIDGR